MTRGEVKARIEELLGSNNFTDRPNDGIFRGGDTTMLYGSLDPHRYTVQEIKITKLQCKMCPSTYWLTNLHRNTDLCKACAKKLAEIQERNTHNS